MRSFYPSLITNGRSILLEQIMGAAILSFVSLYLLNLSITQSVYWLIPFIVPFLALTSYEYIKNSTSFNSEAAYSTTEKELLSLSLLWLLCSGLLLYKTQINNYFVASIPILLSSIYLYRMHLLNRLYSMELMFHTDKYSRTSKEWSEASATLTRSINLRQQNNIFCIFWAIISIGRYTRVYNSIDANRDEYDLQGAEDYVFAARQNLKVCIKEVLNFPVKENIYLFNTSIHRAEDKLSISRCESCGSVHRINKMTRVLSDKGVEEKILCDTCDSEYVDTECPNCDRTVKKSERVNEYCIYCEPLDQYNTTSQRTENQRYKSTHKKYTHADSTTIPTNMTHKGEVETAMSILGVEKPLDRDEIISAYRDRTKETHPDIPTGSEEEFKKVQGAKTTLLEELNKN